VPTSRIPLSLVSLVPQRLISVFQISTPAQCCRRSNPLERSWREPFECLSQTLRRISQFERWSVLAAPREGTFRSNKAPNLLRQGIVQLLQMLAVSWAIEIYRNLSQSGSLLYPADGRVSESSSANSANVDTILAPIWVAVERPAVAGLSAVRFIPPMRRLQQASTPTNPSISNNAPPLRA
jgi:hypothetical protein